MRSETPENKTMEPQELYATALRCGLMEPEQVPAEWKHKTLLRLRELEQDWGGPSIEEQERVIRQTAERLAGPVAAAVSAAAQMIEQWAKVCAQTAEACGQAPAVCGEWIGHEIEGGATSIDHDTCSNCGRRFYQIAETGCVWNYCPNCGAKMSGQ